MRAGDAGLIELAQGALGPLGRGAERGQRLRVAARVLAVGGLEPGRDVIDDAVVPVLAAQAHVALDGDALEAAPRQPHQGDVEGAAAEVVDQDGLRLRRQGVLGVERPAALRRLERVGQGGRGRLVEDVQHVQAGDAAGVLGGLPARVVEVGGHGDDRLADRADAVLRVLDELAQDDGGQGFGAELAAGHRVAVAGVADVALDQGGHALGLLEGDIAGGLADDGLAVLQEHDTGGEHLAVAVGQGDRLAAVVEGGDGREGRAEVDPDQFTRGGCHERVSRKRRRWSNHASL